jgi:hypothetical protein
MESETKLHNYSESIPCFRGLLYTLQNLIGVFWRKVGKMEIRENRKFDNPSGSGDE